MWNNSQFVFGCFQCNWHIMTNKVQNGALRCVNGLCTTSLFGAKLNDDYLDSNLEIYGIVQI